MKSQLAAAVRSALLLAMAVVVLMIGIAFALAGAYASLAEQMPAWQAGGIIGLGTLFLCLVLLLLARSGGTGGGRPPPAARARGRAPAAEDLEATAEMGAAASRAARDFVREHRPSTLELALAAFVVGMVVSRRSRPARPGEGDQSRREP